MDEGACFQVLNRNVIREADLLPLGQQALELKGGIFALPIKKVKNK